MSKKIEVKAKPVDQRDIAFQSHQEAVGLAGMPLIDRQHFDPGKPAPVAVSPDAVIGRPEIEEPKPKLKPVIIDGNVVSGFFVFDHLKRNTDFRRRALIFDLQQIVAERS